MDQDIIVALGRCELSLSDVTQELKLINSNTKAVSSALERIAGKPSDLDETTTRNDRADSATSLLIKYFKDVYQQLGTEWNEENTVEIAEIIDLITNQ